MNFILCDECFRRRWPNGHEEKSCSHASPLIGDVTCVGCGRARRPSDSYHCLGSMTEAHSTGGPPVLS
jgi:hypothetical protein